MRQAAELAELDRLDEIAGRKRGRKEVEDRHKREVRRVRTDELQALADQAGVGGGLRVELEFSRVRGHGGTAPVTEGCSGA